MHWRGCVQMLYCRKKSWVVYKCTHSSGLLKNGNMYQHCSEALTQIHCTTNLNTIYCTVLFSILRGEEGSVGLVGEQEQQPGKRCHPSSSLASVAASYIKYDNFKKNHLQFLEESPNEKIPPFSSLASVAPAAWKKYGSKKHR